MGWISLRRAKKVGTNTASHFTGSSPEVWCLARSLRRPSGVDALISNYQVSKSSQYEPQRNSGEEDTGVRRVLCEVQSLTESNADAKRVSLLRSRSRV